MRVSPVRQQAAATRRRDRAIFYDESGASCRPAGDHQGGLILIDLDRRTLPGHRGQPDQTHRVSVKGRFGVEPGVGMELDGVGATAVVYRDRDHDANRVPPSRSRSGTSACHAASARRAARDRPARRQRPGPVAASELWFAMSHSCRERGRPTFAPVPVGEEVDEIDPEGLLGLAHLPVLVSAVGFQVLTEPTDLASRQIPANLCAGGT